MLDRAVLAGRIHRLQDDQHGVTVVGVEQFLCIGEFRQVLFQEGLRPLLDRLLAESLQFLGLGPTGVTLTEPRWLSRRDPEQFDNLLRDRHGTPVGQVGNLPVFHGGMTAFLGGRSSTRPTIHGRSQTCPTRRIGLQTSPTAEGKGLAFQLAI